MLVVLALGGGGCAADDDRPLVIAAAGPWEQGFGRMGMRGIRLAIDEINAAGGVRSRPLALLERNDAGTGGKAVAVAQELVANREVLAVVGHLNSGAMVAAGRVYDGELVAVSPTASSPDVTGLSPWVFRIIPSDSVNGLDMARFAAKLGHTRAAILYENNSYGRGLMESFRRNFRGDVIAIDPIASDSARAEPYIAYLKGRAPTLVFVAGMEGSGLALLREARRQGFGAAFLGGDGWSGIVAEPATAEGAYVGLPFSPADGRADVQRFVAAFRAKYGMDPDSYAALSYDATRLVARAIERAGSDRGRIRDHLASLGADDAFAGVTGAIRFRESGDVMEKGVLMTRVADGRPIVAREGTP